MNITITGGQHLGPSGELTSLTTRSDGGLAISGERIGSSATSEPGANLLIDADGLIISPGFIDLQINGGFGKDLASEPEAMWEIGGELPGHGVTAFLPTIITSPPTCTAAAITALADRPADYRGAEPFGLHFEGPMLSPSRPGAHPVQHLTGADMAVISGWSRNEGVALVTIAPELSNADRVIGELVARGVTVSAGHSEATAEQARAGLDAGVTMVTHLFNAMSPLAHRNPNLVGVALAEPELVAGLIVDGVHLDPDVVALAWRAKGPDGLVLVTDAVAPMGMGPGTYEFAGMTTKADDVEVRNSQGVLAGSILTMDKAVRNLVAFTGCGPGQALLTATATPASVVGESARGRLEPGRLADVVLLDKHLGVQATICRGRLAYVADEARARIPDQLLEGL